MKNNNWNTWQKHIQDVLTDKSFLQFQHFLEQERKQKKICPLKKDVWAVFRETDLKDVKVVILGQDPYHSLLERGGDVVPVAHGFAFSVQKKSPIPPSLRNIYKELKNDLGDELKWIPNHGDISSWAHQGVFLLNTLLTVEAHKPLSHQNKGWEVLTDKVIECISRKPDPVVFLLWGKSAQKKKHLIKGPKNLVLEAAHPSPFSAYNGFFGCRHFSKTNDFLRNNGIQKVDWNIPIEPVKID